MPGLIEFKAPQPQYKNFAPRIGVNYSPDQKTSIRLAFGMAYDVLFDNLGTLSFPPQLSATNDVGNAGFPAAGDPNFLTSGGLPSGGSGVVVFPSTPEGLADQRAATAAYLPDQQLPYAETWSVGIQRVFGANYTGEVRYVGTRGIHLPTQIQLNVQPAVTAANQLPTTLSGPTSVVTGPDANTLANLQALSHFVPAYEAAGFTSKITSYQPFSQSNYNALSASLQRRFQRGFLLNMAYTWSKTMDDATAEVFSTVLTPRRPQNSQNVAADYSRSALDRTHRLTIAAVYDLPYFKHSNWLVKNIAGNWEASPIYTYESPAYATVLSGVNSNMNGDSSIIDRPIVNPNGVKGTGSGVNGVYSTTLAGNCTPPAYPVRREPGWLCRRQSQRLLHPGGRGNAAECRTQYSADPSDQQHRSRADQADQHHRAGSVRVSGTGLQCAESRAVPAGVHQQCQYRSHSRCVVDAVPDREQPAVQPSGEDLPQQCPHHAIGREDQLLSIAVNRLGALCGAPLFLWRVDGVVALGSAGAKAKYRGLSTAPCDKAARLRPR